MERKQLIIIGSVAGGLVLVGLVAGILYLRTRSIDNLPPIGQTNTPSGPAVQIQVGTGQVDASKQALIDKEKARLAALPKDTDGDGLSDDQEKTLGTNPTDGDTDKDGYNDYEEVNVTKTDPTKADVGAQEKRQAELKARVATATTTRQVLPPDVTTQPAPATNPVVATPTDADGDGLTAEQEATLGTDPNKADTDGDSLTDGEEALTYKTNPLKADTDADGYPDGAEVKSGYNPLGPGKCTRATCIP